MSVRCKMGLKRYVLALTMVCSPDVWSNGAWIQPLLEMQGTACFGYLHATSNYIDFYTPYYDCHRMTYERFEVGINKKIFYLKHSTRMCPVAVVVISHNDQIPAMGVDLYSTLKKYRQSSSSPDVGCWAVQVERSEQARLLPESRRQPVVNQQAMRAQRLASGRREAP